MISWTKPTRKDIERTGDVEKSFHDYLDGYFNAHDFYPVCTRQIFVNNDAYALWSDFLKVSDDLALSTSEIVLSPQAHLALKGLTDEEVTSKNKAATEQALRNLVRAFAER